ncbi:MAG: NADP-dependent malic enzyme [Muribaculaceae bacterium]|nr:NADP-dependent malic enzyme [Muribaculaceae bacterium]
MAKITKQEALDYHKYPRPGKIAVEPTKPYSSQTDLALAYSPGVAYPCEEIKAHPADVYDYTGKGNLVAVISNCTAVLGLGDIGPEAGKPVMEGKALLFKIFAGLDCFDIEVAEKDPARFVEVVKAIAPTFGGINLEDIKAPECFEIERRLKAECDIPVMHDDQHGTAIISAAGLLNALEIQGKKIDEIRLVVNGAGAAAVSCTRLYVALGVKPENVVMCDSKGVIRSNRPNLSDQKREFATDRDISTLEEAMQDADVFLGLSVKDVVTPQMLLSMAANPIVFALANPDPEIDYELALKTRPDAIVATGRSDYPNQINNVLGFPYIFRGALDCGATEINEAMKLGAVRAIAALAKEPVPPVVNAAYADDGNGGRLTFGRFYILPKPLDPRLLTTVSPAVARAAAESGVARRPITDWAAYDERLHHLMGVDNKMLRRIHDEARSAAHKRVVFGESNTDNTLRAAVAAKADGICIPILLGNEEMIRKRADRLGLDLTGIEIVNPRHDREAPRRERYADLLARKLQRRGMTRAVAIDRMYDRNYFGMMMVETGDADAFISGTYSSCGQNHDIAREVIGVRDSFGSFAALHIVNTRRGVYFLADTAINAHMTDDTLYDIARLARETAEYFAHEPVMAMVSSSNFGSSEEREATMVARVVNRLQREFPELPVDGEMQIQNALNTKLRDSNFPFTRLNGRQVNTLVFPNLTAAHSSYRLLLEMGIADAIGPIQIGLKKPVHFVNVDTPVRDIINVVAVAVINASFSR